MSLSWFCSFSIVWKTCSHLDLNQGYRIQSPRCWPLHYGSRCIGTFTSFPSKEEIENDVVRRQFGVYVSLASFYVHHLTYFTARERLITSKSVWEECPNEALWPFLLTIAVFSWCLCRDFVLFQSYGKRAPTWIWTRVIGFRVRGADRYTMGAAALARSHHSPPKKKSKTTLCGDNLGSMCLLRHFLCII